MRKIGYNYKWLTQCLRDQFRDYLGNNPKIESVVLGLSGGIDSALVAALVAPVCKEFEVKLIGLSLPSSSNRPDEIKRAAKCGYFCDVFNTIEIDDAFSFLSMKVSVDTKTGAKVENTRISLGNIKARIRMIILYDYAQKNNGMVLSTDNYTEYLLGFWTLHGDVGDYGLIQNLWKTEVYGLASYIATLELSGEKYQALKSCIDATPTDGLGISSSDLEQIGASSYEEVDKILWNYLEGDHTKDNHPVIQRLHNTEFKRENPFNVVPTQCPDDLFEDSEDSSAQKRIKIKKKDLARGEVDYDEIYQALETYKGEDLTQLMKDIGKIAYHNKFYVHSSFRWSELIPFLEANFNDEIRLYAFDYLRSCLDNEGLRSNYFQDILLALAWHDSSSNIRCDALTMIYSVQGMGCKSLMQEFVNHSNDENQVLCAQNILVNIGFREKGEAGDPDSQRKKGHKK